MSVANLDALFSAQGDFNRELAIFVKAARDLKTQRDDLAAVTRDLLALVSLKYGNLDEAANTVQRRARAALAWAKAGMP